MQSITFALPTLGTAAMSRADQVDVSLDQATAAIVCCYLDHLNALIASITPGAPVPAGFFHTQAELVTLVNDVQGALRSIP